MACRWEAWSVNDFSIIIGETVRLTERSRWYLIRRLRVEVILSDLTHYLNLAAGTVVVL